MQITFEGLARQLYSHKHETTLKWQDATKASGTLHGLGLSGDFSINIEFQVEELEQWITKYLEAISLLERFVLHQEFKQKLSVRLQLRVNHKG